MTLQTEFEFVLPKGYLDERGVVHKRGTMRLSTVKDEIAPLRDPRVRANEAYLVVVLLSQVITRLGTHNRITAAMIESMFAADIVYLQDFYRRINDLGDDHITVTCPNCGHVHEVEVLDG